MAGKQASIVMDTDLPVPGMESALEKTWGSSRGFWGAIGTVDHKVVARRYIVTAFVFLILGGLLALVMRLQLATPEARFIDPDRYNQIFTMHGANMMFLFAVPVMEAMAVYLVPLMVGTRNIAFPRLNAYSYWVFLVAGCFSGSRSCWTARLMSAGSPMCRSRVRNMARANAPTYGLR